MARGGGIYHSSTFALIIMYSTVTGNIAESKNSTTGVALGGAIFSDNSTTQIRNSEISSNSVIAAGTLNSEAYGGGIYTSGLTIWNSTVSVNSAFATSTTSQGMAEGGGMRIGANSTISNSTIVGNSCSGTGPFGRGNGGGVFAGYGNTILRNATIAFNTAEGAGNLSGGGGGGLEVGGSGTVDLGNSIICGNTVVGETATYGPDLGGTIGSAGYNLVGDPADATGLTATDLSGYMAGAVFVDTNSDTVINSLDLLNHGGSTKTLALLSGGVATDAGSNALIPIDPATSLAFTTDQRESSFDRISNSTVDIGAFEFTMFPPYESWATASGLTASNNSFSNDANGDGIPNIVHFALDTDPLGKGRSEGKRRLEITSFSDGEQLTQTIPVRAGAIFSGSPSPEAVVDGIKYQIQGSGDLASWLENVIEIIPARSIGLPPLRDLNNDSGPDWEYRTFALNSPTSSEGFLRLKLESP